MMHDVSMNTLSYVRMIGAKQRLIAGPRLLFDDDRWHCIRSWIGSS